MLARSHLRTFILAAVAAVGLCSLGVGQALPVENRVLVRVNDRIITQYDYQRQVATAMAALTAQVQDPEELRLRREELPMRVLRSMWDDLLVLTRADQLGLTVTDFEVDEMISSQMAQFDMETIEEFEVALGQNGLTLSGYRDSIRSQLLQRQVMGRELFPRVVLEEDELRRVYRDNQNDYQVPETRTLEELVVLETDAGSLLDEIAKRVAADWSRGESPEEIVEREGDAVRFIELGSVVRDDLAPALANAAFSVGQGQVSEPVVARGGLHIVKAVEITPGRVLPFEEVREQVDQDERLRRMEQEREVYLRELEEKAFYVANLPPELSGFRTTTGFEVGAGGLEGISASPLGIELNSRALVEETGTDDSATESSDDDS